MYRLKVKKPKVSLFTKKTRLLTSSQMNKALVRKLLAHRLEILMRQNNVLKMSTLVSHAADGFRGNQHEKVVSHQNGDIAKRRISEQKVGCV